MMLPLAAAAAPQPFSVYDALAYVVWLLLAAVIVGVGIHAWRVYRSRAAQQAMLEEAAERAFERRMLGEAGVAPEPPAPTPDATPGHQPPAAVPAPAAAAFPFAPGAPQGPAGSSPEQARLDALVHRLRATRVVTDREGQMALGLPPDAPIFRLRRGGVAIVLPRVESEAMMANLASRFDLVFVAAGEGRSLVCERLENRLVDLMDQDGLMPGPGA